MKVNSLATKAIKIAIALASSNWSATAQPPPSGDQKDCRCNPDPHFKTWDDTYYDYHGGCDLVLIKNALVDLQVRTAAVPGYSFIQKVGLRVGGVGGDDLTIDGLSTSCPLTTPLALGGYPFSCSPSGSSLVYELTLDDGQFVRVTNWNGSLSVLVRGGRADFSDAVGMCGTWGEPGLVDRGGTDLNNDGDAMGEDWKTIASDAPIYPLIPTAECKDPIPFGTPSGEPFENCPDPEAKCLCADGTVDEALCPCIAFRGEGQDVEAECLCKDDACVTQLQIDEACDDVPPELQEDCEFDVKTTGNVDFGNAPFYQEPAPPLHDTRCAQDTSPPGLFENKGIKCEDFKGAQCVFNCVTSRDFVCKPNLCGEVDGTPPFNNKKKGRCACKVPKHVMDSICSDK